ncbi:hypothetical protein J7J47_11780 [Halomonas sp. ISL-60]|uniref:hypothetical protein n=1 Tax=Halomonas sp. ISL-56 TaxID=2819149 RepID=UPI001BEBA5C4|nr:hypothetical protein [Halomonas sp. ISL-56]MBT2772902.1 hypothetical protein [Halomonas sp. ISL-60]MBT2799949.1 hypothetical protein [Halomonas sp. ISL-56]
METPAEYFRRKLTDEELITRLRDRPNLRVRREAAARLEELTGISVPKPPFIERLDDLADERRNRGQ